MTDPNARLTFILISILLALPSLLAIICGHIGMRRANTVHGLGESKVMAMIGSTIGYLFGSIYLLLAVPLLCRFL